MKNGNFISLEGLSGVGKSTVSKLLANKIGAEIVGTIPEIFDGLRKTIDASETTSINARFLFYLSAVLEGEKQVRKLLNAGETVVVESYLYRTIAFHRGMGSEFGVSIPNDVLMPGTIFHLTCDQSERKARREKRKKKETHWDFLAEKNAKAILREYSEFPMEVVDTTYLTPEDVVEELVLHINSAGGNL